MGEEIKLAIEIFTFIAGLIGLYYKNKYDVKKNSEMINSLKEELDEHCKETPICQKKFENIRLDIEKLKTEEDMKSLYQKQIVSEILSPILKDMTDSLKAYTDIKTGILTKEVEMLRTDNQLFKQEVKESLKELINENNRSIDRIIDALSSNKKSK